MIIKIIKFIKKILRWCFATLPRRIVSTLIIIALIIAPIYTIFFSKTAKAAWWDDNWAYRIAIPVTNNGAQETNVYISATVNTSDTSRFQADCGDIRFTSLHGDVKPYYLASACGQANTTIHVNFDTFPAGAQTIYMYYGNPSAPNGFSASDFSAQASNYTVGSLGAEEKGPGPVAYWKFDEGQGSTAYNSTSQTGINGTLQNSPTWKPESDCVGGKCLEYNGTTQYVSVDDTGTALDFVNTNQYTWSAWINYSGFPAGQTTQCFLSKDGPGGVKYSGYNLCLNQNGNSADFVVGAGGNWSTPVTLNLASNKWAHIGVEYDGASNWKVYVNGNYQGSQSYSVTSDTASKCYIGAGSTTSIQTANFFFQGKIDSVKIFPYQRTSDQIKMDYNSGKSGADTSEGTALSVGSSPKWMTDGLVGQWKMDEASGTNVADASGNGNTGTLTNAQETGTAQTGSNTTTILDGANAALSSTNDAYKNMILQITSGGMNGTQRTITGYTGATKTFAFAALGSDPTGATYIILHQTGGKFGNGLALAGDNDYIVAGTAPSFVNTQQYTWSAWVNYSGFPAGQTKQCFLSKDIFQNNTKTSGFNLCLNQNGSNADFIVGAGNTWSSAVALGLAPNNWNHLEVEYDGTSNWKVYVNGIYKGSQSYSVTSDSISKYFVGAGCIETNGGNQVPSMYFQGFLDDVRIYNRALSPDEVKALSEWGPRPVGYWNLDEGSGTTAHDTSGNNRTGTLSNGAWAGGKYGKGVHMDGDNDNIQIPDF